MFSWKKKKSWKKSFFFSRIKNIVWKKKKIKTLGKARTLYLKEDLGWGACWAGRKMALVSSSMVVPRRAAATSALAGLANWALCPAPPNQKGSITYNTTIKIYIFTRLPVTRWVKLSLNFESQSRVYLWIIIIIISFI